MADWQTRLRKDIEFTSPLGTIFSAQWRGSPRSKTKKVARLELPLLNGEIAQDLGSNSATYPLVFAFEGANNDIIAAAFYDAIDERGPWSVEHPVHGFMALQPLSVREVDNPTESGNITEFTSEWMEPIDDTSLQTARELAGIVEANKNDVNAITGQQFDDEIMDFT